MAATSQYEIEIIITNDGKVKASVEGLTKSFVTLTTALARVKRAQQDNAESIVGTNKYYAEQISKAEQLRDRTAKTSEAYAQATKEIDALRMAQAELIKQTVKAQAPQEGTLAFYRKEIALLREEQAQVAKNNQTWKEYENRINSTKDKMAMLTDTTRMSAKPNQDLISSAGLAGATLTEFGRVISDANYGIRGIANNLSQLSFLFITLISKTTSAAAAFKLLWKQIMGPLGLILAFQAVISVIEYFAINQDKAGKAAKDFEKEIASQTNALYALNDAALAAAEGTEERAKALQALGSLNKEINDLIKNESLSYEELNSLIRTHIEIRAAEARSNALANKFREDSLENFINQVKIEKELEDTNARLTAQTKAYNAVKKEEGADAERIGSRTLAIGYDIKVLNDAITRQTKELNKLKKEENELTAQFVEAVDKQRKLEAEAVSKAPRTIAFWQNQIKILQEYQNNIALTSEEWAKAQKEIEAYQAKINAITGEEEARKISTIARDLADELAVINRDRFDAQRIQADQEYRDTLEDIKEEEKERIISAQEAEEARVLAARLRKEKINQINQEEKDFDLDLTEKAIKESQALEDKFEKAKEASSKAALDRIDKEVLKSTNASKKTALEGIKDKKLLQAEFNKIDQRNIATQIEVINAAIAAGTIGAEVGMDAIDKLNAKLVSLGLASADPSEREADPQKKLEKMLRQVQEAFNFVTDAAQASLDAELSIEESRTAMLNNSLRLRLRNEKLTAEQREAINNQIAKNEESLQQKRDKLAEKQFKLQKAISIGQALITTYEMASRAYNAVLAGPEKFLGVSALALAKVAAGAATLFGLAQVRAISRQQFVPSAISTPSGGGEVSAPTVQAPDFNVVGQSNVSQLAAVVQGQLDRPVKTYVVASDVSTAQELERKKISTATI